MQELTHASQITIFMARVQPKRGNTNDVTNVAYERVYSLRFARSKHLYMLRQVCAAFSMHPRLLCDLTYTDEWFRLVLYEK